jgi:hypothetical protein
MSSDYLITGTMNKSHKLMLPAWENFLGQFAIRPQETVAVMLKGPKITMNAAFISFDYFQLVVMEDQGTFDTKPVVMSVQFDDITSVKTRKSHLFWWGIDIVAAHTTEGPRTFGIEEMEKGWCKTFAAKLEKAMKEAADDD